MKKILPITICLLVWLFLAFVCVDCSMGKTKFFHCTVSYHQYAADYIETTTSTDGDGHITTSTTYCPEKWHVVCENRAEGKLMIDVLTDSIRYAKTKDGDDIWIRARCGRFTDSIYMPVIVDGPPKAE